MTVQQAQQLATTLEQSKVFLLARTNLEGIYTYVNPLFNRRFSYIANDFIGLPFVVAISSEDMQKCIHIAEKCIRTPEATFSLVLRKPSPNGGSFWTNWEFSAVIDETNGAPIEIMCIGYDVTDQHQLQSGLSRTVAFQGLLIRMATALINTSANETDREINQLLELTGQFAGADRAYVILYDFANNTGTNTHEWCATGITPEIQNLQQIPISIFQEWADVHTAGEILHIARTAELPRSNPVRAILEPQGIQSLIALPMLYQHECLGCVGFDAVRQPRDWKKDEIELLKLLAGLLANAQIRQRYECDREKSRLEIESLNVQLEQRVTERTRELTLLNQELEAFAYSVSHDLKAPLRHIRSFIDLLGRRIATNEDETVQRYNRFIADAATEMHQMIEALLDFSSMNRQELKRQPTDFKELVEAAVGQLTLETRGRKVHFFILQNLPQMCVDYVMMKIVFVNLLSNAIKFTRNRPEAKIEIGWFRQNNELVFFVRDNGVGFSMQAMDKLFGVFQRLHPKELFEGNGVGLANVRRIISRHGGTTWAAGEVGKGATFYFSLPESLLVKEDRF
ncbi:MAG TPA: ATP-binding protein [Saprospiraceae bacterium]|nr:ATP-binding protein [Saprospiraceae bacterium]